MGVGRFDVTLVALAKALKLPEGAEVVAVVGDVDQQIVGGSVTVVVRHPDIPSVVEGAEAPRLEPWWDEKGLVSWGE